MADEIRRSGRATKGQHTNKASSSPAPSEKAPKATKSKPVKKSSSVPAEEEASDDDTIRCICGDDNPEDKRAFIGCDDCSVWQHNICMGVPEDDDEVPDSYLCEQCGPDDHRETLQAMARGEKIWETRNRIYQNEKKSAKKAKKGKKGPQAWLKKDVPAQDDDTEASETGSKRKRGAEVEVEEAGKSAMKVEDAEDEKPARLSNRQDKRRKSAAPVDPETAIVDFDKLPSDRQKIVTVLSKVLADDISVRAKAGDHRIPDGHTAKSQGEYYALRIEYALKMNHEDATQYGTQFRALNANLKKNRVLIENLLKGSLLPDTLSTMTSAELASEELQKERLAMKEQLDRQAIAIEAPDGPKYRRTHKGDELIEDENAVMGQGAVTAPQPVRERTSLAEGEGEAGSPMRVDGTGSPRTDYQVPPLSVNTRGESSAGLHERRQSSQQFDINNIWAKTAQSPTNTTGGTRPLQMPPRRRSSIPQQHQQDGTKVDADVDRLLQDDDDEAYSPTDYTDPDTIVWTGKLVQAADAIEPTVNGRFVAGRDISRTVPWDKLLPVSLNIDGRLSIDKAEEYLCSLQYSTSSDVSVLAFTPDAKSAEGFDTFFEYFRSRQRYAVVKNDKPEMVKDLYIIPLEAGEAPPSHIGMMEYNIFENAPAKQKCLLATFVIGRAPPAAPNFGDSGDLEMTQEQPGEPLPAGMNGQQHALPQHMRPAAQGPSGSPLNVGNPTFSPTNNMQQQPPPSWNPSIPPNPYTPTPPSAISSYEPPSAYQYQQQQYVQPTLQSILSPQQWGLVNEVLGPLANCTTAQQVVEADPNVSREKLEHLRNILEEHPATRDDPARLSAILFPS